MKQKITKVLFSFLIVTGLFSFSEIKATVIDNEALKAAIGAFLKDGGDVGDGYIYNWQILDVPNPDGGEDWWTAFCNHQNGYIYSSNGEYININISTNQSYEAILCRGKLDLTNIDNLYEINLNSNYLEEIIIHGCNDLETITFYVASNDSDESEQPGLDESIETIISITGCPKIYYFNGNFASVKSFTWTGTGSEDEKMDASISAYYKIKNVTLTNGGVTTVYLKAPEITGDITVTNCSDFNGFSIDAETSNNVNLLFSNNSNTSEYFDFYSENVALTTLPEIPSSVQRLTLECVGNKFSGPLNLSNLTNLTSLTSRYCDLSAFPKLSESISELYLDWSNDYFSEKIDLKDLRNLESLQVRGFSQFPNLPESIKYMRCGDYGNSISGEIDLTGLSSFEELYCDNNQMTSILNIPSSLKKLICYNNEITRISFVDLSSSLLSELDCSNNKITALPATLPVTLEELHCGGNEISGILDLSELSSLSSINCENNNLKEVKLHDTFNGGYVYVEGNQIPISNLIELASGFDNLLNNKYSYLPQQLTDERSILSGETVDLSEQLVDNRLSCTWFDITNDIERLRYDKELGNNDFSNYLITEKKITDNNKIEETEPGVFLFKDEVKGKYLLCEISETSEKNYYYRYATHYCLVYVENSLSNPNPEIVFEVKIDGNISVLPNNSETTVIWTSMFELSIKPPVIPEEIIYDTWEITYFDSNDIWENKTTEKIAKSDPNEIDLYFSDYSNSPTKISVVELKLYNGDVNVQTYSYASAPYRQTFILDSNPILWYEEKINEEEYIEIENNITTTKEKGNKVFLRMGVLAKEAQNIPNRSTPAPNNFSWAIEYTTSDGGTPVRSRQMNAEDYYDFNEGNPHQDPGIYPYSVKKLFIYNGITVDNYNLRSTPGPSGATIYDFTDNPYNHTIIIKGDGTEPEPEPEVGLQFAVSINDSSFSDIPNLHTTTVAEGDSVYLDIRTVTRNITFNSWKIEYTTPAGQNVSSGWLTAGAPHHFNSGSPHTIPGTYVYTVNQLQLQGESQTYTYNYSGNPYRSTIVITKNTEPEPPGPDPEPEIPPVVPEIPDPDPNPDAWIFIEPLAPLCYEEWQFFITVKRNTTDSLYYAICYPQTSLDAGFEKDSIFKVLPADGVIPVAVNNAIPKGFYYGYVVIWSKNKQETELYPFRIEVKDYVRITKQPEAVALRCEGDGFKLSVETEGEVLAYQWFRNSEPIPGATTNTYEAVLSPETIGAYYVKVEGYCNIELSDTVNVGMSSLQVLMKWDDVMYVQNTDNRYVSFQWYKDGTPISKYGTSIYYTDSQGLLGSYYVEATRADGTVDTSCPITFDTLTRSTSVSVYPNPVAQNENLTVVLNALSGKGESAQINILDTNGRPVYSKRATGDTIHIPVNFPMGSYVLQVITAEGRVLTEILLVK